MGARTQAHVLKMKQDAADTEFRTEKAKERQQRILRAMMKEQQKVKKKLEKERQKKAAELKKKWEATLKKNAQKAAEAKEGGDEKEKEEEDNEPEEPEEVSEVEIESDPEADPQEEEPPKVELTAEEKSHSFIQHDSSDLTEYVMNASFTYFSLPCAEEGFDAIKYAWSKKDKAPEHLKQWIIARKITTRVEDITPSAWFKQKHQEWQGILQAWKSTQNEYKGVVARKTAEKASKAMLKAASEKKVAAIAALKAKQAAEAKKKEEE